ncbi:trypsin-2-like [Bradysia coprophila]|uniref:trypsin-2-like n=1 Tax=Bradysia coprophila TaxID=38358 RepID=UPI00187D88A6|nr:trypsin-2-like [Bradysia coprophila]
MSNLSVVLLFFQAICFTIVSSQDYPYQVYVTAGGFTCGGTLIANDIVVSAILCADFNNNFNVNNNDAFNVNNNDAFNVVVRSGSSETETTATTYQVSDDLALFKLDPPISFNEFVQPIPIADRNPIAGDSCVVPGWVETDDAISIDVQLTNVVILAKPVCQSLSLIPLLNLQRLCVLNVGACVNDLGAPLVCNGKLSGVSVGTSGCVAGVPQVYADVDAIRALLAAANL